MTLDIRIFAFILAVLAALAPFSIDTYLPAIPSMADYFGASVHQVEWSVSSYFLGFAIGQLLGGPLSDVLGRRKVALWGLVVFVVSSALISLAPSVEWLIGLRVLQAIGGGFSVVVVSAIVRDRFEGREAARVYTLIGFIMMVAPLSAPVIGALILEFWNWQSIFIFLALYGVLTVVGVIALLAETRARTRSESGSIAQGIREALVGYTGILAHRKSVGTLLAVCFSTAALFVYLTDSAFVFIEYFGFSHREFPVLFAASVVAMMAFNRINARLLKHYDPDLILYYGLMLQFGMAVLLLLSALLSGSAYLVIPVLVVTLGSLSLIFTNGIACYMAFFGERAGAANAVLGTSRFIFAALLGGLVGLIHDGSLLPMTGLIALCSLIAFTAIKLTRVLPDTPKSSPSAPETVVPPQTAATGETGYLAKL